MMRLSLRWAVGAGAVAVVACAGSAEAGGVQFYLRDHPSTGGPPNQLGLRLGNVFTTIGGPAADAAFSMNTFNNTVLTVDSNGPALTISISGTLYGGAVDGAGYGFGEGAYQFAMSYTANVSAVGDGWEVSDLSPSNTGTLTALAQNNGVAKGTTFSFTDKGDNGPSFIMQRDGYLLTPGQIGDLGNPWVGRGWLMIAGVDSGAQDLLFTATPVPLPTPALLGAAGLVCVAARRRR